MIRPEPTPEEAAAIAAAIETLSAPAAALPQQPESRWRWSGRWWTKPVPLRRDRPW